MSHQTWTRDQILVTSLLAISLFLAGLSAAAIAPYRAVVAVKELGFSNGAYAAIITVSSLATAIASLVLGALSDRIGDRRKLVILSAVMGGVAYALIFLAPGRLTYIVAFCAILPFGGALFSQTFAFSRAYYDRNAPDRAVMMTSVLRTMFSAAWVVVPPVAGWIASTTNAFNVFAFAAAGHLGCTMIFVLMLRRPDAHLPPAPRPQTKSRAFWRVLPFDRLVGLGGILALRTALLLQLTLLPLAMLTDFQGSYADVGLTAALAAGLEIPCMLAWGWIATRWRLERILILNALIYAAYLIAITRVSTPYQVLWLQGPNAVATAALVSLTITYVQDSIKGQVGLSTSLLDVLTVAATLLTAGVFRTFSSEHSYLGGFLAAGGACLIGAGLLALAGRMNRHKVELPVRDAFR
jgi:SET family sugar efflux transporter-like MFS transporter